MNPQITENWDEFNEAQGLFETRMFNTKRTFIDPISTKLEKKYYQVGNIIILIASTKS